MQKQKLRTIIAGSRTITDPQSLLLALDACPFEPSVVICGMARGADTLGEQWADGRGIPVERFPADWDRYGKFAGYKRNVQMAEVAEAAIILWDGQSRGASHMADIAQDRGLRVFLFKPPTDTTAPAPGQEGGE